MPDKPPAALFVDQTAKLGGAELCLKDIVLVRGVDGDHVVLLEEGPLAEILRRQGQRVSVYPLGQAGGSVRKASGLWIKLAAAWGVAKAACRVAKLARQTDVLYANTAKSLVVSSIAGALARRPVVYHLHDILSAEHFSRSNLRLLSTLAKRMTTHVIANSDATADALVALGGKRDKITVVYNGIDPYPFERALRAAPIHRARVRGEMGVCEQPVIGLFGRLAPWKGQHLAIETLSRLPCETHLMIVGDALFGETNYSDGLRKQVEKAGLSSRVHFLGFRDNIAELMQACDLVLHCSTAPEPFGRVIVEAMLSRRPVIASNAGGAAEIVLDGQTGFLVAPADVTQLSDRLHAVLEMGAGRLEEIVQSAFLDAKARFELQARVDDVTSVINRAARK